MESKQFTRQGVNRSAIQSIGQDLQRWRWTVLAPKELRRRPVFQVLWTSLRPDCGQPDHRTGRALPANLKNWSNEPYWTRHALGLNFGRYHPDSTIYNALRNIHANSRP